MTDQERDTQEHPSSTSQTPQPIQTPFDTPTQEPDAPIVVDVFAELHGDSKRKFSDDIWKQFTQRDRKDIGKSVFVSFFDLWGRHRKHGRLEEFDWSITKDFFESDEKWETYVNRNESYRKFFGTSYTDTGKFTWKDEWKEILRKRFITFADFLGRKYMNPTDERGMFEEGHQMSGFNNVVEFKKIYADDSYFEKKYKVIKGKRHLIDEDKIYVPELRLGSKDVTALVQKYAPDVPTFANNPNLEVSNFNRNEFGVTRRVKLKIERKVELIKRDKADNVIGSYVYECPVCGKDVVFRPHQLTMKEIKHFMCPDNVVNGKPKDVPLRRENYESGPSLFLHCYEVNCYEDGRMVARDSDYFYSFDGNIKPGIYNVDVATINAKLCSPTDRQKKPIMFGLEKSKAKTIEGAINPEDGKKLSDALGLLPHKILDVWAGGINYYKRRGYMLDPHKGAFLQLGITISCMARALFGYRNFLGSVIGDTSISKTYSVKLVAGLLDPEFGFTTGKSQTYAGIYGGINNDRIINGTSQKVFEEGITSRGFTAFDEGSHFYTEKEANDYIKDFLNAEITIVKMGGRMIPMNFTPFIFCNFFEYHKGNPQASFDKSYESRVKFFYWKLVKESGDDSYHDVKKVDSDVYVMKHHLYLPLQCTDNLLLRQAMAMARMEKIKEERCWWTGGSIASQNRILFDCVVKANKKKFKNPFDKPYSDLVKSDNIPNIPAEDFCNTMIKYIRGQGKEINLKRGFVTREETKLDVDESEYEYENTKEQIKRMNVLRRNIQCYLKNDPDGIILHFSDGRNIDEKIADFIEVLYFVAQLCNNYEATDLDASTILLCKTILLKCKRGLTEDEYNFKDNSYRPDPTVIGSEELEDSRLDSMVTEINSKEPDINQIADMVEKKMKKHSVEVDPKKKPANDIEPTLDDEVGKHD